MPAIRNAVPDDAAELLGIYGYYVSSTAITFEYEIPAVEEFRSRIADITRRYPYLVIEQDGRIAGYAYAAPFRTRRAYDWCCETTVYIDRGARRSGLGRMLYGALEHGLARMGIRNMYACITCPVREDEYLTADSEKFHARMGFERVAEFRNCGYKFGRWYNMIFMEKIIGSHPADMPNITGYPDLPPETDIRRGE